MKSFLYTILAAVAVALAVACSESSSIGNSLSEENITIVVDSDFTINGSTVANSVVQSRTLSQLIGSLDAKGYGSIRSDFVGQFMPSLALDTAGVKINDIDSVKLFMQMVRGAFVGDSLVPMGVEVYRLTKDLPYPIYSNFDPEGYYDPSVKFASGLYTASTVNEPDSIKALNSIVVSMPLPLSFAHEMFTAYDANPSAFADPSVFARDVFKGIYIRSSYGGGRISDFTTTSIRLYYHKEVYNTDSARYETKKYVGDYFAITPEVVVNNNIHYDIAPELKEMADAGEKLIAAPAGYEVEMTFPAPELLASYEKYDGRLRVINTLTMSIPVETIENDFDITPPPYVLLVLKKDKEEFFADNSLVDNKTSFYAAYNSSKNCYDFTSMRAYLLDLIEKKEKGELTADDYTFVLTPVQVNMEESSSNSYGSSSYVVSSIVPYVSKPAMGKISLDEAKIILTFSAGSQNNY